MSTLAVVTASLSSLHPSALQDTTTTKTFH